TKENTSNDWIIDSGASQHISAQRERFTNYLLISTIKIQIGDGSEIEAIGKGNMILTVGMIEITLHDVLHVPKIGSNLLSIAKVVDHGHHLLFSPSSCQIRSDKGIRMHGIREGNVYLLRTDNRIFVALSNKESAVAAEIWHRRIGHRNFSPAAQGIIQNAVTGLHVERDDP